MNTDNNSSNFWLQVKKEYIDENLEALINYLSKCTTKDRESHDYKLTTDALKIFPTLSPHNLSTTVQYPKRNAINT